MPDSAARGVRVLFVTGAYYPEISAAAVQVRDVASALQGRVQMSILTTAVDSSLPPVETVGGVTVYRVHVDVRSRASKALASIRLAARMLRRRRTYDIIHVHGFSRKNVPVSLLGGVLGKPVVLSLHTAGQDEPEAVKARGVLAYRAFATPRLVLSVSPQLEARWRDAGLPAERVRLAPNGIDVERFRPSADDERRMLRRALGWPEARPVVLFVGFFSRDKRPDLLFRAWRRLDPDRRPQLVFVGAKGSGQIDRGSEAPRYYEIDDAIGDAIRRDAAAIGAAERVTFVEPTNDVDRCFRAADLFVLPSVREAHPLALLEAMACGLPVIATRLPGATDVIVEDGRTGRLVPPDDEAALASALTEMLAEPGAARAMGARARETVAARYDIRRTAEAWLDAYRTVLNAEQ